MTGSDPEPRAGRGAADKRDAAPQPYGSEASWDDLLARLEDFLLAYPFDRALPDFETILARAGVPAEFVRADERALKVLHEAIVARPLSTVDAVSRVRTEVEFLTLEVRVLGERLRDPRTEPAEVEGASARLARVRRQLEAIRHQL